MQAKSQNGETRRRVRHPGFAVAVWWMLVVAIATVAYWLVTDFTDLGETVAVGISVAVVFLGIVIMSRLPVMSSLRRRRPD